MLNSKKEKLNTQIIMAGRILIISIRVIYEKEKQVNKMQFFKQIILSPNGKRFRSPGIKSKESILLAYAAWWAGTTKRVVVPARQAT